MCTNLRVHSDTGESGILEEADFSSKACFQNGTTPCNDGKQALPASCMQTWCVLVGSLLSSSFDCGFVCGQGRSCWHQQVVNEHATRLKHAETTRNVVLGTHPPANPLEHRHSQKPKVISRRCCDGSSRSLVYLFLVRLRLCGWSGEVLLASRASAHATRLKAHMIATCSWPKTHPSHKPKVISRRCGEGQGHLQNVQEGLTGFTVLLAEILCRGRCRKEFSNVTLCRH